MDNIQTPILLEDKPLETDYPLGSPSTGSISASKIIRLCQKNKGYLIQVVFLRPLPRLTPRLLVVGVDNDHCIPKSRAYSHFNCDKFCPGHNQPKGSMQLRSFESCRIELHDGVGRLGLQSDEQGEGLTRKR